MLSACWKNKSCSLPFKDWSVKSHAFWALRLWKQTGFFFPAFSLSTCFVIWKTNTNLSKRLQWLQALLGAGSAVFLAHLPWKFPGSGLARSTPACGSGKGAADFEWFQRSRSATLWASLLLPLRRSPVSLQHPQCSGFPSQVLEKCSQKWDLDKLQKARQTYCPLPTSCLNTPPCLLHVPYMFDFFLFFF